MLSKGEGLATILGALGILVGPFFLLRAWTQVPGAYHFRQEGPTVFDLPRDPLSAEQEEELRAFLRDRALLPG